MKKSLILLTIVLLVSGLELCAQNKIKLYGHKTELTSDPKEDAVEIDADVAMQSSTLKNSIEDVGGIQEIKSKIPLPFISHDFLKTVVVPLMEKLNNYNYKMPEDQKEAGRADLIKAIQDLQPEQLLELLRAANYLDIRILGKEREDRKADIDRGLVILLIDEIQKVIAKKKELENDSFLIEVIHLPSELQKPISTYLIANNRELLANVFAKVLKGHADHITSVAITPDGRFALTGSSDQTARIWNLKADPITSQVLCGPSQIWVAAITPDGRYALTAALDSTARLWDLSANPITYQVLAGHTDVISSIAITPDGKYALTGSWDRTTRFWDLTTNPITSQQLRGHTNRIRSVAITPDGQYALTGSDDGTVRFWDLAANPITSEQLIGHAGWIKSVAITPDARYALTGSEDNTARLWDLTANPITSQLFAGHTHWVTSVAITPDGKYALTASQFDNTPRFWDLAANPITFKVLEGHTDGISAIVLTPDGRYALTSSGTNDSTARLWDLKANPITSIVLEGHTLKVRAVDLTPDARYALTGSFDETAILWDLGIGNFNIDEVILIKKLQKLKENNLPYADLLDSPIMATALLNSNHKDQIVQYFGISEQDIQKLEAQRKRKRVYRKRL